MSQNTKIAQIQKLVTLMASGMKIGDVLIACGYTPRQARKVLGGKRALETLAIMRQLVNQQKTLITKPDPIPPSPPQIPPPPDTTEHYSEAAIRAALETIAEESEQEDAEKFAS